MTIEEVLQIVINRLGDNYLTSDHDILEDLLKEKIFLAECISNRPIDISKKDENLKILMHDIIYATIQSYQQRGVEGVKNQSELGTSSTFIDVDENLRNNIIKNGKRVIF